MNIISPRNKYPMNPLAKTMSYSTRLKRYEKDKEDLLRNSHGIPALELQTKFEKLIAWWGL